MANEAKNSGEPTACSPGDLTRKDLGMTKESKNFSTVPLNWKEVYYTNCPLVSASNVDQELGWTREEYKKIGVKYASCAPFVRTTGILTTFTTLITSSASAVYSPPSTFTRTSAGPGSWG